MTETILGVPMTRESEWYASGRRDTTDGYVIVRMYGPHSRGMNACCASSVWSDGAAVFGYGPTPAEATSDLRRALVKVGHRVFGEERRRL